MTEYQKYTLTLKLKGNKTREIKDVSRFRNAGDGKFLYFEGETEKSFTLGEIEDFDLVAD